MIRRPPTPPTTPPTIAPVSTESMSYTGRTTSRERTGTSGFLAGCGRNGTSSGIGSKNGAIRVGCGHHAMGHC